MTQSSPREIGLKFLRANQPLGTAGCLRGTMFARAVHEADRQWSEFLTEANAEGRA